MRRSLITALIAVLTVTTVGWTLPIRHERDRHIGSREAAEIANYWVQSYLRHPPDAGEVRFWAERLIESQQPRSVLAALLAGPEYYGYAGGTRYGYIHQLLLDVGHREPSRREIEGLARATAGSSLAEIADNFLRQYPANWWPGPAATPPRELEPFYERFRETYRRP